MAERRDVTIIGGGPGGYVAAIRAAQLGAKVAIIEKDQLGGTCLNRGCIPTKSLVKSIEILRDAKAAGEYGVEVGQVAVNFARMMERKRQVSAKLVGGVEQLIAGSKVAVSRGRGRIARPGLVQVEKADGSIEDLETGNIIIATGSVSAQIPFPGVNLPGVITSDDALELKEIPSSMVIIGGGVIGVELAGVYAALGTKISIVEMLPMILPPIDEELARRYNQLLRREGVQVNVSSTVKEIRQKDNGELEVCFDTAKGPSSVAGQYVLMAVGRSPYTEGLGLSDIGIQMNRRAIAANDRMETNLKGIYAIGDVVGGIMLAHVASYEGEIAVENALGHERRADYKAVPGGIYTIPEIASVGLTEKQAKDAGATYSVSKFPFTANGRATTMGDTTGIVKLICEQGSGKVLGAHIMGPHATELIHELTLGIQLDATARDVAHTIHAHPTLSEAILEAALGQLGGSIHFRKMELG